MISLRHDYSIQAERKRKKNKQTTATKLANQEEKKSQAGIRFAMPSIFFPKQQTTFFFFLLSQHFSTELNNRPKEGKKKDRLYTSLNFQNTLGNNTNITIHRKQNTDFKRYSSFINPELSPKQIKVKSAGLGFRSKTTYRAEK